MKDWKVKILALAIIFLICFIADMKLRGFSSESRGEDGSTIISCIGEVIDIEAGRAAGESPSWTWSVDGQIITLRILSGKYKGQEVFASNIFIGGYSDRVFSHGDKIYVSISLRDVNVLNTGKVILGEYVRTSFLLYLAAGFLGLMIVIGGMKGVKSVLALLLSGVFIISVLIPMCLKGYDPVLMSLLVTAINTIMTFLLVGGITRKSLAGILGTVGGLITTAVLAFIAGKILHFTGMDVTFGFLELGKRLWMSPESNNWDFSGLLTAGMILGASGAMMDSSMAVASAIDAVKKANPRIGIWGCIKSGLNVGKDEMGTMANTLIFAYIGADMTLILMPMIQFGEAGRAMPLTRVINEEGASAEVIQALSGTIGLIMAIPITAFVAGFLIGRTGLKAEKTKDTYTGIFQTSNSRRISGVAFIIALAVIALGVHITYSVSRHSSASQSEVKDIVSEYVRARVIDKGPPINTPVTGGYAVKPAVNEILKAKLLGGNFRNEQVLVQNILDPNRMPLSNIEVNPGDEIILKIDGTKDGIKSVFMNNYSRDGILIYFAGFFIIVMAIIGRFQGIRTAIALGLSITVIFKVLIPLIIAGYNALLVVICVSGIIAFLSLIIVTGFNRKAGSATIGILGGVIVASLIVLYADQKLHFTGISSSKTVIAAQFTGEENLDFRKILMAGIIMGLLGTAMDAAVIVASSVREIRKADPGMPVTKLITAGMNVGTDVMGTMSNTLIFAYFGLRIILMMTFTGTKIFSGSKIEIMSAETLSAEILRLLAGSIGLILTIPLTAVVASFWDKIVAYLGPGLIRKKA